METFNYVYTVGMTDTEVETRLADGNIGVLALADARTAYAVPISYYYDGRSVFFRLTDEPNSRKHTFADTTEEACFALFGADTDETWSILVRGPLHEVPDPVARGLDETTLNTELSPIRVFDGDIEGIELVVFELEIDSVVGRQTAD